MDDVIKDSTQCFDNLVDWIMYGIFLGNGQVEICITNDELLHYK